MDGQKADAGSKKFLTEMSWLKVPEIIKKCLTGRLGHRFQKDRRCPF